MKSSYEHRNFFRDQLERMQDALEERLSAARFEIQVDDVRFWKKKHLLATTPVTESSEINEHTVNEIDALELFAEVQSEYTPCSLANIWLEDS